MSGYFQRMAEDKEADEEFRDALEADNAALRASVEKLEKVLNLKTPYPLDFVLEEFGNTVEHLHHHHNCDCLGYELRMAVADAARDIRAALAGCGED